MREPKVARGDERADDAPLALADAGVANEGVGVERRQLRESDVAEFFALVASITDKIQEA